MSNYPANHQEKIRVFGTNDASFSDLTMIVADIFLLKSAIMKSLSNCRVIPSKSTFQSDINKAALTIRNLNKHLSILDIECIENDNINDRYLGKKDLHLNTKRKGRQTCFEFS